VELGPVAKEVAQNGFIAYEEFSLTSTTSPADNEESSSSVTAESASKKRKFDANTSTNTTSEQLSSTGRSEDAKKRIRSYLKQGIDHLIIASKYRPLPILKIALYLLCPSSPFVIYHEFVEPLVECCLYLQEQQLAIRLQLSDTWTREFQTLPGRTRPEMFMSTSGGYLLTGIYVGMLPRPFLVEAGISSSSNHNTTATSTTSDENMEV
jgi:tRNA (adenine58-N1)-methyltransferase non-catalytic subunit